MGTKKQTMRNRVLAFAVVMVYALALLPSFAFAATTNDLVASAKVKIGGTADITATVDGSSTNGTIDADVPFDTTEAIVEITKKETGSSEYAYISSVTSGGTIVGGSDAKTNQTIQFKMTDINGSAATAVIVLKDHSGSNDETFTITLTPKKAASANYKTFTPVFTENPGSVNWTGAATANGEISVANLNTDNNAAEVAVPYTVNKVAFNFTTVAGKMLDGKAERTKVTVTPAGGTETPYASGTNLDIKDGANVFDFKAVSEDDSATINNRITITRTTAQTTANISGIAVTAAGSPIDPSQYTFVDDTESYDINVPVSAGYVEITPTLNNDSNLATLTVAGQTIKSGNAYKFYINQNQNKSIKVQSVSQDGKASKVYTYNFTKKPITNDTSLKELEIANVALSPAFSATNYEYTGDIANSAEFAYIKATPNADKDTVVISISANGGAAVTTPEAAGDMKDYYKVAINKGKSNQLVISSTAKGSGAATFYTVNLTAVAPSNDATVKDIKFDGAWTDKAFHPSVLVYVGSSIPDPHTDINATIETNHPYAKIEIIDAQSNVVKPMSGKTSAALKLATSGTAVSKITVKVTSEDGKSSNTYTYMFTKDANMDLPTNPKVVGLTEITGTIRFTEPKNMEKYAVYYRPITATNDAKWVCGGTANKGTNEITVRGLQPSTKYEYKVTAGKIINGKMSYYPLAACTLKTGLETTAWLNDSDIKVLSKNADSITFSFKNVPGAESYAIYYAEGGANSHATKNYVYGSKVGAQGGTITIKNINPKKAYCFALTSGKTINGRMIYLPLPIKSTDTGHIDVAAFTPGFVELTGTPTTKKNASNLYDATFQYNGVTGDTSYALYAADSANGTYRYVARTSNPTEIVASNLVGGNTYYFKITSGKMEKGKMVYTSLADIKTITTVKPN